MTRPTPPHQPRLGREPDSEEYSDSRAGEDAAFDGSPHHDPGESSDQEPVRVRVNDESKVSRVDTGQLEETPVPGSRFSSWRQRRRSAKAQPAATEVEATDDDPDTVVAFPRSSHRRIRRNRWLALLGALLAVALFVGLVFFSPLFATRAIDVEGARLTDPQNVEDALQRFEGVPLTRISKDEVREAVGNVPQVKSVNVILKPPHTITVELHERVGVATVQEGQELILVDSQGKQLSTYGQQDRPDVPMIGGGRDVLSTDKFSAISDVLASLPASVLSQLDTAAAPSESAVELTFADGRKAIWGDSSNSELKAQVLAALVNDADTADGSEYDVSAPLHPTVK
ncbi:FtsQ-type POTRA domain-containing protein [Kocuria sp. cx-116]|uniref:cell division protein FtsQ/DivIB n=1 Tax=Kocuria sp. cx-116 TaxID=2771378 RepID=UPI001689DC99|nr:FtsQ-type POTRA domain-containing protein [Kocuria sp. cx-116]MBD2763375.1 FtsQ-type POTRA domain-containing protein [Kocuria sp. cx-116]